MVFSNYYNGINVEKRGLALVDAVIGVALFALVIMSLLGVFRFGLEVIGENKARVGALALANEQIEFARSLAYSDVGTVDGSPVGLLLAEEAVVLNGITYTRATLVSYYDDPKDGTGGSDADGNTNDYKKMKISMSWALRGISKSVFVTTSIAQ